MPGVVRQGDLTSGHGCWPPQVPQTYSPNVFVNNLPVVRNGDIRVVHCCPPPCHSGTYIGSNTVYANGQAIQKQGDPLDCGDSCQMCSPNVFIM